MNNNILQCDHCKKMVSSTQGVFTTTPDTVENRLTFKRDENWCKECIMRSGRKTLGQQLHELNEQRKHETK